MTIKKLIAFCLIYKNIVRSSVLEKTEAEWLIHAEIEISINTALNEIYSKQAVPA